MRLLVLIVLVNVTISVYSQEIAITFDDAPTGNGPLFSGEERTEKIIAALQKHDVGEAAFFVLTGGINNVSAKRLHRYSAAGHILANHSNRHLWIHEVGTRAYVRDLSVADSILKSFNSYVRWYRYPYLDEGRNVGARDSIRAALKNLNMENGYVTVDNYDWYLNNLLMNAKAEGRGIDLSRLRDVYLDHIYNSVLFYDSIAQEHLGRSPKHVLLLHENDLSALFLGDLLALLKSKGWKIISPREAYEDPIAHQLPDVLFNGQGRVAAIARSKGIAARELVQDSEDEAFLDQLIQNREVFK